MHIRQTEIAPLVLICQSSVIDSQLIQDCGVEIVNMNWVLHCVVAEFISSAKSNPRLDASTCHPHCETVRVMVPPVVIDGEFSLAVDRSTELAAPDHQCVVQESALL